MKRNMGIALMVLALAALPATAFASSADRGSSSNPWEIPGTDAYGFETLYPTGGGAASDVSTRMIDPFGVPGSDAYGHAQYALGLPEALGRPATASAKAEGANVGVPGTDAYGWEATSAQREGGREAEHSGRMGASPRE